MKKKFPIKLSKTVGARWQLDEFLPKRRFFWVVFDMSNGDSGSKRYVWWFDTRKAAREHIQHQRDTYGAELSAPHKVEIVGY